MWKTGCLEKGNHKIHVEERAWRVIDWARNHGIVYTEKEIKEEILKLMKNFTEFTIEGPDCETSFPKIIIKGFLSKLIFQFI
ncbi:MAG: hypothetical protein ACTSR3_07640 [Candidatus Helarchaeota archaeon]